MLTRRFKNTFHKSHKFKRNPLLSAALWPTAQIPGCNHQSFSSAASQPSSNQVFFTRSRLCTPFPTPTAWGLSSLTHITSVNNSRAQRSLPNGQRESSSLRGNKKSAAAGRETSRQLSIKDEKIHNAKKAWYQKYMKKKKLLLLTKAEIPPGNPPDTANES